jgi:hypothetical protein
VAADLEGDKNHCGSEPAREDGLPANQSFPDVLTNKTQPKKSHLFGGSPAS